MIFMINNKDKDTTNEVNLLIDKFISSYSTKTFGKIPLLIINNIIKGKTPLRAKEIKLFFKLEKVKKKKIPFKYYSINVIKVDPILFEPLNWLIKQIFT